MPNIPSMARYYMKLTEQNTSRCPGPEMSWYPTQWPRILAVVLLMSYSMLIWHQLDTMIGSYVGRLWYCLPSSIKSHHAIPSYPSTGRNTINTLFTTNRCKNKRKWNEVPEQPKHWMTYAAPIWQFSVILLLLPLVCIIPLEHFRTIDCTGEGGSVSVFTKNYRWRIKTSHQTLLSFLLLTSIYSVSYCHHQ
jgi:hypothetical protein